MNEMKDYYCMAYVGGNCIREIVRAENECQARQRFQWAHPGCSQISCWEA